MLQLPLHPRPLFSVLGMFKFTVPSVLKPQSYITALPVSISGELNSNNVGPDKDPRGSRP